METLYKATPNDVFIKIHTGGKSGKHLHIDCVVKEWLPPKKIPKATNKQVEVKQFLENFIGSKVNVGIIGGFVIPLENLPPHGLIRSLLVEQKKADVAIRLISGTFAIEGTPVQSISWGLSENKKGVFIKIEAVRSEIIINENYLKEICKWINDQFVLFIGEIEK